MGELDNQRFCLRWNNFPITVVNQVADLLDLGHLTDVTLTAEGRNLNAHRVVLSACSIYFRELFKDLTPTQHPVVILQDAAYDDLSALISFIYRGEVHVGQNQLPSLLKTAQALSIRGLGQVSPKPDDRVPSTTENQSQHTQHGPSVVNPPPPGYAPYQNVPPLIPPPYGPASPPTSLPPRKRKPDEMREQPVILTNPKIEPMDQPETEKEAADPQIPGHNDTEPLYASLWNNLNGGRPLPENSPGSTFPFGHGPEDVTPMASLKNSVFDINKNKLAKKLKKDPPSDISTASPSGKKSSVNSIACPVCYKMVSNPYNLRVHMDLHNGNNYPCPLCGHESRSKDALRKHLAYRHLLGPNERKSLEVVTASNSHSSMSKDELLQHIRASGLNNNLLTNPSEADSISDQNGHDMNGPDGVMECGRESGNSSNDECDLDSKIPVSVETAPLAVL